VKSYVTLERNGFVFLWYHAEGIDPVWEPPEIEEIAGGQWKYCGRSEHHINAHIEVYEHFQLHDACVNHHHHHHHIHSPNVNNVNSHHSFIHSFFNSKLTYRSIQT